MQDPRTTRRARELRSLQTEAESLLWTLLRGKQVSGLKFRRQHPIGPYYADFACDSEKLIVELDGDYHEETVEKDQAREAYLMANGWQVVRFSNQDVLDDVESVARAVATHAGVEYEFKSRPKTRSGMMSPRKAR